jgi:hypothetical protein
MAVDNEIRIQIIAAVEQLQAGMNQAAASVQSATNSMKGHIDGLSRAFEGLQKTVLAFSAIAVGGKLFGDMIKGTLEFNAEAIKLQRILGLTADQALQTNITLKLIGRSTDEYVAIILRLERQLRVNEDRLNDLGVVTRNVHGEYLKAPEIFQNALKAVQQFKVGTDQNLASIDLFGRGAQEMFSFFKFNESTMARAKDLIHQYNIELESPEVIRNYKMELAALGLVHEQLGEKITHQLLPVLQSLTHFFSENGPAGIRILIAFMRGIMAEVVLMGASWGRLQSVTKETWSEIVEIVDWAQKSIKAVSTFQWSELETLYKRHQLQMTAIAQDGAIERAKIDENTQTQLENIFKGEEFGPPSPIPQFPGGTRSYVPKATGGGGGGDKKASDDRMSIWRDDLHRQLEDEKHFFSDSKQEELSFWTAKLALTKSGSEEDVKLQRQVNSEIFKLRKELAHEEMKDKLDEISNAQKLRDADLDYQKTYFQGLQSAGEMSAVEELQTEKELLDEKLAALQRYYTDKEAAAAADSRRLKEIQNEEALAYKQWATERLALDNKTRDAQKARLSEFFSPIKSAIGSAATGVAQGTQTLGQAQANIAKAIGAEVISKIADTAFDKLENILVATLPESLKDIIGLGETIANTTALTANTAAIIGNTAALAVSGGTDIADIFAKVGTVVALGAQGGMVVPSAAGGWALPSFQGGGMLAELHTKEMVLPANISEGLQGMITAGGGRGGGTTNINITAWDSRDVGRFVMNNSHLFTQAINRSSRLGAPPKLT